MKKSFTEFLKEDDTLDAKEVKSLAKPKLTASKFKINLDFDTSKTLDFKVGDIVKNKFNFDFDVYLKSVDINLQRELVWTLLQKQAVITTILKGIKLPTLAIIITDDDVYEVIDGKQRLSTIKDFYNGKFPLTYDSEEYYWDDLEDRLQSDFLKYTLKSFVVHEYLDSDEGKIPDKFKHDWFDTVNFAGTPVEKSHQDKLRSKFSK